MIYQLEWARNLHATTRYPGLRRGCTATPASTSLLLLQPHCCRTTDATTPTPPSLLLLLLLHPRCCTTTTAPASPPLLLQLPLLLVRQERGEAVAVAQRPGTLSRLVVVPHRDPVVLQPAQSILQGGKIGVGKV